MATGDDFTIIDNEGHHPPSKLFDDYQELTSGKISDLDAQITAALRAKHPELTLTTVPASNINLLHFSSAGFAQADLDEDAEPVLRWRGFAGPAHRGGNGHVVESRFFARYNYTWNNENFIVYSVLAGRLVLQYILKEPRGGETPASNSSVVTALISTIGAWLIKPEEPAIYVYDGYWTRSTKLWQEVEKAKWEDVILDPKMKKAVTEVANKFFDSKDIYDEYGVPWKRGIIFHGPVGNGKTVSLKALMHTLQERKAPVVTLYVKSASYEYHIRAVFQLARAMSPCMLVLEDIDTIVTEKTRSYFFNEVDGLENNDGIMMVATTNHLDKLDPGLSKRPSRFDRKYLFPLPNKEERSLYAQYWRNKLKDKKSIDFPSKLCEAIADITDDFSFAYLKEAFVATLLELAHDHDDESDDEADDSPGEGDEDDPLDKYEFWRAFKAQVKILRREMGSDAAESTAAGARHGAGASGVTLTQYEEMVPLLDAMGIQGGDAHPQQSPRACPPSAIEMGVSPRMWDNDRALVNESAFSPVQAFAPLAESAGREWEWPFGYQAAGQH